MGIFEEAILPDKPYDFDGEDRYRLNPILKPFLQSLIRNLNEQVYSRKEAGGRNLILGFVENTKLNAFATSRGNTDVIAIHVSVYPILLAVSRAIFSHPEFMPSIGSDSFDKEKYTFPGSMKELEFEENWAIPPLADNARDWLAQMYALGGLSYIVHHEAEHLMNGHVAWLKETRGVLRLQEIRVPGKPEFHGLSRQTLEWDADCGAIVNLLMIALRPEISRVDGEQVWELPVENQFGSVYDAIRGVAMCVYLAQLFFNDDNGIDIKELILEDHPPCYSRHFTSLGVINEALWRRAGLDVSDTAKSVIEAMNEMESGWRRVFNSDFINFLDQDRMDVSQQLRQRYSEEWSNLRAELLGLSIGGKLAPVEHTELF